MLQTVEPWLRPLGGSVGLSVFLVAAGAASDSGAKGNEKWKGKTLYYLNHSPTSARHECSADP